MAEPDRPVSADLGKLLSAMTVQQAADAMADVAERLTAMTTEANLLRQEVAKERSIGRRWRRLTVIVALVMIGFGLLLFGVGITNVLHHRNQGDVLDYLVECTSPGDPEAADPDDRVHPCWDRLVGDRRRASTPEVPAGP